MLVYFDDDTWFYSREHSITSKITDYYEQIKDLVGILEVGTCTAVCRLMSKFQFLFYTSKRGCNFTL